MTDSRIVKIFGERNTGTRALAALVRQVPGVRQRLVPAPPGEGDAAVRAAIDEQLKGHWRRLYLHALRDDLAASRCRDDPWKHAVPRLTPAMIGAGVSTLLMVRDPYSWLVGLARRPYHMKGPRADTLEAFVRRPWMTERREGMSAVVASPMTLWTVKAAATLAFGRAAEAESLAHNVVRFEDFVQAPAAVSREALAALGIEAPALSAEGENTKQGEAALDVLQTYYAEERWTSRLTRGTVAAVNALIDWEVASALGYERRDPGAFPDRLPPSVEEEVRAEMASLTTPAHRGRRAPAAA